MNRDLAIPLKMASSISTRKLPVLFALFLFLFTVTNSSGQELKKWTFDTESDFSSESGFTLDMPGDRISVDSTMFVEGGGSIRIDCVEGSYCGLQFEYSDVGAIRGKAVELSVDVKTEYEGTNEAAYLHIRSWSEEGEILERIGSPDTGVFGTNDWSRIMVTLPISREATRIEITVHSDGIGSAWFDNLTITAIDWTLGDAIISSPIVQIWTGSWYDWLKILMAYLALPLGLLFAASRSGRKEQINGISWPHRFLGFGLLILAVTLAVTYNLSYPFSPRSIMKIGGYQEQTFYAIVFAFGLTIVWWRNKGAIDEVQLWRNIGLVIRFFLIGIFFIYAFSKFHRSQFAPISELQLDTRLGDLNSMRLLWLFFGHSFAYVLFVGASEMIGAILLMFRRTYLLGAAILVGVISNIVFTNFAYSIPVKFPSSIFLVMAIFLLLEEVPRIWSTLVLRRSDIPPPTAYRPALKPLYGVSLSIAVVLLMAWQTNEKVQVGGPKSKSLPFTGVWVVQDHTSQEDANPATSWGRLIVESSPRYWNTGVGTVSGDAYSGLSAASYSDSLQTFSMTWNDSTDTFTGRYFVDGDTLRLSGIQYGDTLNVRLVRRRFRLEPDK